MTNDIDFSTDRAVSGEELLGGNGRLSRIYWLSKYVKDYDLYLFQDGAFSQQLFTEVLETFVSGQFIATIVLGFSFIERTIAGRLFFVGEKGAAKGKSKQLLKAALRNKWLTESEFKTFDDMRNKRNPIAHFHDHLDESRPEVDAIMNAKTMPQQLETDAKNILKAAINLLKKTSL